jgi:hypothetical protein
VPPWEHWPTERLRKEEQEKPRVFARGFRMVAYTDDERMFPSFTHCYSHGTALGNIARSGWPVYMGVDLSGPKRKGTAIFAGTVDPMTQRRYPLEIHVGAWTSPETAKQIGLVHGRYPNVRIIMVENNGYQQALIDWIKGSPGDSSFWFKIKSHTTGSNKSSPEIGLPSLEVEFANKAWVIAADEFEPHGLYCKAGVGGTQCGWCRWTGEMLVYPMSATTDTVMATWFFREAVSQYGSIVQSSGSSWSNAR